MYLLSIGLNKCHFIMLEIKKEFLLPFPGPEIDSDESWSPASGVSSIKSRRKSTTTTLAATSEKKGLRRTRQPVIDKKERKKIQNVEAARRYRYKTTFNTIQPYFRIFFITSEWSFRFLETLIFSQLIFCRNFPESQQLEYLSGFCNAKSFIPFLIIDDVKYF